MKVICRGRGQGKTTDLIKMSAENNYYLVCSTRRHAEWVFHHAKKELGLDIPFPITFDEFIRKEYYGKGIKGFLIDDAEQLFQHLSRVPVFGVSITDSQSSCQKASEK